MYYVASPIRLLKPREMFRTIALTGFAALVAASTISLAPPARAQIGNIFSDPPLRPPGAIPRGNQQQQQAARRRRGSAGTAARPAAADAEPAAAGAGRAAARQRAVPAVGAAARYHRRSAEYPARDRRCAAAAGRSGQRLASPRAGICRRASASPTRRAACRRHPPACSRATRWSPSRRRSKVTNKKASFSGLDKITGRIINFDEDIGETVQFGALRVKTDACYTRPSTEAANTDAFVEVDEITLQGEVKRIFSGWMYAASPGLHGVEHPIYDIWLTDCKVPDQTIVSAQPDPPKPPPPPPAAKASAAAEAGCAASAVVAAAAAAVPAAAAAATAATAAGRIVRRAVRELSAVRAVVGRFPYPGGRGFLRIGVSVSSCSIRSAAPSRSSYCPLLSDHMKAASAVRPRPSAIGIR